MTEYQVGSLGNLISGTSSNDGARIVYEKVIPNLKSAKVTNQSADGRLNFKTKGTPTIREKGRRLKEKISGTLLSNKKPEIAGDENTSAVAKSWKRLPNRSGENSEVDGDSSFSHNATRRILMKNMKSTKKSTIKYVDDPEKETRTVFVGNIPYAHAKKKKVLKFFSTYGEVESVRFRCAPLKDPRMSKKVAVIKQEFHPERSSICAYVVFKSVKEAESALLANGAVFNDHHLRVDMAKKALSKEVDPRRSIFIGNLAFSAEEEDLWKLFSKCGTIENIRIIRDPISAVSKGIAFVNFESSDGAELALQLDESFVRKRQISVQRHTPSAKPASEKSQSEKSVRHKSDNQTSSVSIASKTIKEEIKMQKKQKRRMRREGEKMLGIVKKKKRVSVEDVKPDLKIEPVLNKIKVKEEAATQIGPKKVKYQGQTVDDSRKKKKKINIGELKKKKVAHMLGAGLQKKKKKSL